jgi:hypothetical protein
MKQIIKIISIILIILFCKENLHSQFYEPVDTIIYRNVSDIKLILKIEVRNKYKFTFLQMKKRYKVKIIQSIMKMNDSSLISKHETKLITFGDACQLIKFDKLLFTDSNIINYKYFMICPFGSITIFDSKGKRIKKTKMIKYKVSMEYAKNRYNPPGDINEKLNF